MNRSEDLLTEEFQSRAIYFGTNNLAIDGFSLWAYQHANLWTTTTNDDILLNNTGSGYAHVTGDATGTEWSYGPVILWPTNRRVTFFAYAPHYAAVSVYAPGAPATPVIDYRVSDAVGDQDDLIISEALYNRVGPTAATLMFHHALTRIEVSAVKAGDLYEPVRIRSVTFKNLYNAGTAALDLPISWSVTGSPINSYTLSVSGGTLADVEVADTETSLLSSPGSALLLMPQPVTRMTPDLSAGITVAFTMGDLEFEWEGSLPSSMIFWEPGHFYNYKLHIGGDAVAVTCSELEPAYPGADWNEYGY